MTPAEHRARAELIATGYGGDQAEQRAAQVALQEVVRRCSLTDATLIALGQLHALLAVPFTDPDEIIEIRPIRPGSDRG